jgi:CDGSH-type Zn-finger protein/uncharacterized Fe-S cluster protein YjdI
MSKDKPLEFAGEQIDVTWVGDLCIHVGECGRAKGELFIGGRKPWCQPDVTSSEEVIDVVERCPTGALTYQRKDDGEAESAAPENTAVVAVNGPLFLRGKLQIANAPGDAPGLAFRAALCRCGQSKNKPFCDNSHLAAKFEDYGAVGDRGKPLDEVGGALQVTAAKDGPLLLKGKLTLVNGSGQRAWQGEQVALCRCGASENKPFCDGKHKEIGFSSD